MADRDHHGRFARGHAPTGGRPAGFKGVAKLIMESTRDGAEMVEYALRVFRDEAAPPDRRWAAMEFLASRSLGKPVAVSEMALSIEDVTQRNALPEGFREFSQADKLRALDAIERRLLGSGE